MIDNQTLPGYWFIFSGPKMLLRGGDNIEAPLLADPAELGLEVRNVLPLGQYQGQPAYAAQAGGDAPKPEGFFWRILLGLDIKAGPELFWKAGDALYALHWHKRSRFCGVCGSPADFAPDEEPMTKRCTKCGALRFPRLSPAVIVAIEHDGRLLLANNRRHPKGFYSVLAGFVGPSESLEDAVRREMKEEVGLDVTDIRYFGSQPWPFPDSLMVAFQCRAVDDKITVDGEEIQEAAWFTPDNIPMRPLGVSVAARLVEDYIARHTGQ